MFKSIIKQTQLKAGTTLRTESESYLCSKVISGTQNTSKYNLHLIAQGKQPHRFNTDIFTAFEGTKMLILW